MPALATKTIKPAARTLRVLGNPIPGLVRAALTVGRETAEYVFARRTAEAVGVRKAGGGEEYTADLAAGRCSCPAGVHGKPCKHVAAAAKLSALGHL